MYYLALVRVLATLEEWPWGWQWNISITMGWIALNPHDFSDPLTSPLAPPACQSRLLFCEIAVITWSKSSFIQYFGLWLNACKTDIESNCIPISLSLQRSFSFLLCFYPWQLYWDICILQMPFSHNLQLMATGWLHWATNWRLPSELMLREEKTFSWYHLVHAAGCSCSI